jgi:hypothetical protein
VPAYYLENATGRPLAAGGILLGYGRRSDHDLFRGSLEKTDDLMEAQSDVGTQLISDARERAALLIAVLQALRDEPIEVARERAAATVNQYCGDVLESLSAAAATLPGTDRVGWIKQRYAELAMDFAQSVCQIETDAARRHAVAQAVQQQILELERRLRAALDALGGSAETPVPAVSPPAGVS